MGMDVFGKNPTSETGKYFRNNVWWWRPLANYCLAAAPQICAACKGWHSNDGEGLNKRDSLRLADALQAEIDSGRCNSYAEEYAAAQAETPDEKCDLCNGTGIRSDATGVGMKMPEKIINETWSFKPDHPRYGATGWCNGCDGRGHKRPYSTMYPFSVENVREFVAFLRDCGGFEIC